MTDSRRQSKREAPKSTTPEGGRHPFGIQRISLPNPPVNPVTSDGRVPDWIRGIITGTPPEK